MHRSKFAAKLMLVSAAPVLAELQARADRGAGKGLPSADRSSEGRDAVVYGTFGTLVAPSGLPGTAAPPLAIDRHQIISSICTHTPLV